MAQFFEFVFGEPITRADQIREQERILKHNIVRAKREANNHAESAKRAQAQLTASAKKGNEQGKLDAAREIVRERKEQQRASRAANRLGQTRAAIADAEADVREVHSIAVATDVLNAIDADMPKNAASVGVDFSRAMQKSAMRAEMIRDGLDSIEEVDEDEEDQESGEVRKLMQEADLQVLHEKQQTLPKTQTSSSSHDDDDLQRRLRNLVHNPI